MLKPETPIRVVCADDQQDIVDMLRAMIDQEPDMECVQCSTDAQDVLDYLAEQNGSARSAPTVVLLDYVMPGLSPMIALEEIRRKHSDVRVVLCSGHDEASLVDSAFEAGAWGVISKHNGLQPILEAIRRVGRGEFVKPMRSSHLP